MVAAIALAALLETTACTGEDPDPVSPPTQIGDGGGQIPNGDPPGTKCTTNEQCKNGFCVDGFCCNRACTEQCEACNLQGHEGTCSFASGSPVGSRAACAGSGACAGSCDGTIGTCHYPPNTVVCGAACDGTCNAGQCSSAAGGTCPGGFACGASSCLTACTKNEECQPFFKCNTGSQKCEREPESDCLDGKDNNGDGLADCADPTCAALVECVPAPQTSGELGILTDNGACPTSYTTESSWHSGLVASTCTGCSCKTTCQSTTSLWNGVNNFTCTGNGILYTLSGLPNSQVNCQQLLAAGDYYSGSASAPTIAGCTGTGTATQADPTWATTKKFCAAKVTSTCADAGKRCVAKTASKVCARGGQADACPSGYGNDLGVFYSGFVKGSCTGSCTSCTPATAASMQCKHVLNNNSLIYGNDNCQGAAQQIDATCTNIGGTYKSVGDAFTMVGTDNCTNNITNVPPTASGGARFCCAP